MMSTVLRAALSSVLALLAPGTAHAEWMRAESRHFVVYEEGDAATVRDAAERLEKLNRLQHAIAGAPDTPPLIKARVYLLANDTRVRATMPYGGWSNVSGYYVASMRGPAAVNTRADDRMANFPAQLVLFHELTHHFMFQYFSAAYPVWYSEGFADFMGSATIDPNNVITIGAPVNNRYFSLRGRRGEDWIAARKLLTAHSYGDVADRVDLLYAQGWLLTHYLTLSGERQGQLARYLTAINAGKTYGAAAAEAFGDLGRLDHELHKYAERNQLPVKEIRFKPIEESSIAVAPASAAQSALMTADIMLDAGVPADTAARFAEGVRKTAMRFPDDPVALRLRVEADRLADEREDRATALARWAIIAPNDTALSLQRCLLAIDQLSGAKDADAAKWDRIRADLLAAHGRAPNDPAILKAYYDSYLAQGVEPTPGAQNALFRALDIVPQDDETRYELATGFEKRRLYADAIAVIRPAAFQESEAAKPQARAAAERLRARYRLARQLLHETARDLLARLEREAAVSNASTG